MSRKTPSRPGRRNSRERHELNGCTAVTRIKAPTGSKAAALAAEGPAAHDPAMDPWSQPFTVDGNRLTMLPKGPERMDALLALIRSATRTLRVLYYIYVDDAAGAAVRDALIEAAQ